MITERIIIFVIIAVVAIVWILADCIESCARSKYKNPDLFFNPPPPPPKDRPRRQAEPSSTNY